MLDMYRGPSEKLIRTKEKPVFIVSAGQIKNS